MPSTDYVIELPIEWENTFGGYLLIKLTASMTIRINQDITRLTATLNDINVEFQDGAATGGGFINIAAIGWMIPINSATYSLSDVATDSFTSAWEQLLNTFPELTSRMIYGVAVNDATGVRETRQGINWQTYSTEITREQLESGIRLVNMVVRYYSSDDSTVILRADTSFVIDIDPEILNIAYYPFAVYSTSNSVWLSCNRDGGFVEQYIDTVWSDRQNTLDVADESTCFNYSGSTWEIAPLIGEDGT